MTRKIVLLAALFLAFAACNRTEPPPAPEQPVIAQPTPAGSEPVVNPSVPSDIAAAPARPRPARPTDASPADTAGSPDQEQTGVDEEFDPDRDARFPDSEESDVERREADALDGSDERPPAAMASDWNGFGELEFGADVDDARDRWPNELEGDESESCFYLSAQGSRNSGEPALMFESGRLVRYDVDTPRVSAPGGGRVGMDTEEILDRYGGDVERRPHKYTDGEYLRIEHRDSVLLFETDAEGVVTEWRVGVAPQVDYVEGCS